jgi:hypothetical protein
VSILLLGILFLGALASTWKPSAFPRHVPLRVAVVGVCAVLLAVAMWRVANPQGQVDFDTWFLLALYKQDRFAELFIQHRPLQYAGEYFLLKALGGAGVTLPEGKAAIAVASALAGFAALYAVRRRLFGTAAGAPVVLAFSAFLLTSGGTFLVDAWDDHLPLLPVYFAGVAALLGMRVAPWQSALAAIGVFVAGTLLHTGEPWLWGVAAVAAFLPFRRGKQFELPSGRVLAAVGVFLAGMALTKLLVVSMFPGGIGAIFNRFHVYGQRDTGAEALRIYAAGFAEGGILPLRARFLIPALCVWLGLIAVQAWWRGRPREWIFLALALPAVGYPLVYEPWNPEHYWISAVLWALMVPQVVRRCVALRRLRTPHRGRARQLTVVYLGGIAVAVLVAAAGLAASFRDRDKLHEYNRHGLLLKQKLDPTGTFFVAPAGSFYLWQEYWYGGEMRPVRKEDDLRAVLAGATRRPVYINQGVFELLNRTTTTTLEIVFERPGDPSTPVYLYRK